MSSENEPMHAPPRSLDELDARASEPTAGVLEVLSPVEGDIVVAGAGGKMGFHLCLMLRRALDEQGRKNRVLAVSRFGDPATRGAFEKRGVDTIPADLTKPGEVESLPDAGTLFYLAGKKFGTSDSPEELVRFNERMPALVAERYAGIPTVALSTGCVYPFVSPESGGSREEDPIDPPGDYARSCAGRERAFLDTSAERLTPIALIRLNYAVDLRYGVLVDIALKVRRGEPVDVTMGYLNCIWQGDALEHTVRALGIAAPCPHPGVLNVTGSRILSVREIATWFGKRFETDVALTGEEADTAWLNNPERAHRLFGPPRISETTLMEWVADWIENERPLLDKPTRFEVRDGRY